MDIDVGAYSANNSEPTSNGTVTVISTAGDLTSTVAMSGGQWVSPFTNRILKWGPDIGEAAGDIGPGTTTHVWTDSWPSQIHALSGANFKASSTP